MVLVIKTSFFPFRDHFVLCTTNNIILKIMRDFITNLGTGIAQPVKRQATGIDGRGAIPSSCKRFFSLFHKVQTGLGDHVASYPVGTGNSFPVSKAART
jgi:hypothetical protein